MIFLITDNLVIFYNAVLSTSFDSLSNRLNRVEDNQIIRVGGRFRVINSHFILVVNISD